jgi:hypothetical protein
VFVEEILTFLPNVSTLREILDFFEFLPPAHIAEIKRVYSFVVGRELFRDVQSQIRGLCGESIPEVIMEMIMRRLSGISRVTLQQDLLLPYSPEVVNAPDHTLSEDALENFFGLVTSHNWSAVLSALKEFLPIQRLQVEEYVWKKKSELGQPETLRDLLLKFGENSAADEAAFVLFGFDGREAAARIREDVTELSTLRAELPVSIELVLRILAEDGFDLIGEIESADEESTAALMRPYLRTILFAKDAFELGAMLKRFRPLEGEEVERLADELSKSFEEICAFERSFDRLFGSLRLLLKQLASAGCLERKDLAFSSLRLEAADSDLCARLQKLIEIADFETVQQLFKDERDHLITIEECYDVVYVETELRAALNHMDASLNAICRCLLLLDGYDSEAVAQEIHLRLQNSIGSEIVQEVVQYLRPSTEEDPNPYIPEDMNWVDEMYLQIRIAYREKFGNELLPLLVERGIGDEQHKQLAYTVYGTRTAEKAAEVYSALRGKDAAKGGIEKVRKTLGTIDPRLRECVVSLYNAYFAVRPGHRTLEMEIKAAPGDPDAKVKLLKIVKDAEQAIYL